MVMVVVMLIVVVVIMTLIWVIEYMELHALLHRFSMMVMVVVMMLKMVVVMGHCIHGAARPLTQVHIDYGGGDNVDGGGGDW